MTCVALLQIAACSRRRERYVQLYKKQIASDASMFDDAVSTSVGISPFEATELDRIEIKELSFEQALLFRYIAEVRGTTNVDAVCDGVCVCIAVAVWLWFDWCLSWCDCVRSRHIHCSWNCPRSWQRRLRRLQRPRPRQRPRRTCRRG